MGRPTHGNSFLAQPMISAMLAHNANPTSRCQLDPYELDAPAGANAYATKHMLAATCGQAMLTADGRWLLTRGHILRRRVRLPQNSGARGIDRYTGEYDRRVRRVPPTVGRIAARSLRSGDG
jgi:hypothetical protein